MSGGYFDKRIKLGDLVGRKRDPVWGSMRYEKSLVEVFRDQVKARFEDDGAGGNLYDYHKSDIQHDYSNMLRIFGPDDEEVKRFKTVLDNWDRARITPEEMAKGYTRLALMKVAQRAGNYSVDDLIRVAGIGLRELTPGELERVVRHVAGTGFDPNGLEKCGGRLSGLVWNGKTLKGSDMLPPGEAHYLRHVVHGQEWPDGTTLTEYYQSLEDVIRDPESRILISKFGDEWQVGFLGENQPGTQYTYTWVDYRVSTHHWVTGLRFSDVNDVIDNVKRTEKRWLR